MDPDFKTLGSIDNPSDCNNGLGVTVGVSIPVPTQFPVIVPTGTPTGPTLSPSLTIENFHGVGSYWYACSIHHIPDTQSVTSFYIANDDTLPNWRSGQVNSADRWSFSELRGMNLPYHVKLMNNIGQEVIVYNAITNFVATERFDLGTNFGVKSTIIIIILQDIYDRCNISYINIFVIHVVCFLY